MELIDIIRAFFALTAVVGMIGLLAIASKRLGLQNGVAPHGKQRRLSIVETMAIDQRRRAAIIACDGREHLIILDAARVTVIERGMPSRAPLENIAPVAAHIPARPPKSLYVPPTVLKLIQRAPKDKTTALRAAGLI